MGYTGLALAPWYLLPICWFIAGTAIMGLVSVANDCEQQTFVKSKFLNDVLGMICMVPLWMPYRSLSKSSESGTWLNWGPLWVLRSLWQWMRANFALPLMILLGGNNLSQSRKGLILNLICLYGFFCIFFPLMTMTLGVWGLFKFYIIPMLICHFWLSTCLKLSNQIEMDDATIVVCSYPRFVEFIGGNFNQIISNLKQANPQGIKIPSYNTTAARLAIKSGAQQAIKEVKLSWTNLFFSPHKEERLLMRVHGISYDFTNFKHPGGTISINLGRNRDATALFEAHHPFTSKKKLATILKKYKINDDNNDENETVVPLLSSIEGKEEHDVFDWNIGSKEDAFAEELIEQVTNYFKSESKRRGVSLLQATKATPRRWAEMIIFSLGFLITIPFFVQGYWFSVIALPVLAWLYAAAIVHDAMHFAVSTNWKVNAILGNCSPWTTSPLMWYHQHVIGHHAYPNIPFRDPDLAHAPAFVRLHESIRWKQPHKFQLLSVTLIWTLGAAIYMIFVPIKALVLGVLNRSVHLMSLSSFRIARHIVGRIFTAAVLWGWQWYVFEGDLPRQIIFTVAPMLIHSLCFMFSTQLNHLTAENTEKSSRNYYVHQILTSHSFSMDSQLVFWFTGGLNLQIEHHLFPTVNHCHLKAISPIVRNLCKKYSIPYHESSSVIQAVGKHFKHVHNMSKQKIA